MGFGYYTAPVWTHKAVVSGGDSGTSAGKLPLEWLQEVFYILEVVTRGLLQVRSVGVVLGPGGGEGDEPICSGRNFPSLAFVSLSTLVL